MTHVTCRLTAKNRDQLRNPTLGNRVWATFTFLVARKTAPVAREVMFAFSPTRYAMPSQSLWSQYDRHVVGITRHNALMLGTW